MQGFTTRFLLVLALAFLFCFPFAALADEEQPVKVTDIQIAGNKKVETETIRSKMGLKVGDAKKANNSGSTATLVAKGSQSRSAGSAGSRNSRAESCREREDYDRRFRQS